MNDQELDDALQSLGLPEAAEPKLAPAGVLAASGWRPPPVGLSGFKLWTAVGGSAFLGAGLHAWLFSTTVEVPVEREVVREVRVEVPYEVLVEREVFVDREVVRHVYHTVPGPVRLAAAQEEAPEEAPLEELRWPDANANQPEPLPEDTLEKLAVEPEAGGVVAPEDPTRGPRDKPRRNAVLALKGGAGLSLMGQELPEAGLKRDVLPIVRLGATYRFSDQPVAPLLAVVGDLGVGSPEGRVEVNPGLRTELGLSWSGSKLNLDLAGSCGLRGGQTRLPEGPGAVPVVGVVLGAGFGSTRIELSALRAPVSLAGWGLGATIGGSWPILGG